MKIQSSPLVGGPQSQSRNARGVASPGQTPDGYAGSAISAPGVFPVAAPPGPSGKPTVLAQQGARSALAASGLGWLDRVKGLGLQLVNWVTGASSRAADAQRVVEGVLALEKSISPLSDAQIKAKTQEFRTRLAQGASLEDIQVEAYAVAREAAARTLGLKANDKQILGAAFAHQGSIVEMKTGEGKTLMALMPAYLHALQGQGVHIITANEYLAQRDCSNMGRAFEALGMTTAVASRQQPLEQQRAAHHSDVVYSTAAEIGFQYLTDHLAMDPAQRVCRDLSQVFALVDEADKVLLDEANTPLILSSNLPENPKPIQTMAAVVRHLREDIDFQKDEKTRQAWLTEAGLERVEKILGLGDLYSTRNEALVPYLHAAVQAQALYQSGVHYLKQDEQIVLVDEFTGRPKPGHRFSEGLHQAIEAKEGLRPGDSMLTLASITYPNLLQLYGKLSGMTGTGLSAENEFAQIYGLPVNAVPTHQPVKRQDLPDLIFDTAAQRDQALADQVADLHKSGRPVLIGSRSIERSEQISAMLQERGIPHQVLNAKNLPREAEIIAQAGRKGAVTVATNMAGRGTDIKLGGDPPDAAERSEVVSLGGLAVVGSERHEARRIDEQLAGRGGRQGDPGTSQFFLSREDDLFRIHLDKPGPDEVARAQQRAEDKNLEHRNWSQKFDHLANLQRGLVYARRDALLDGAKAEAELPELCSRVCQAFEVRSQDWEPGRMAQEMTELFGADLEVPAKGRGKWLQTQLDKALSEQKARMGEAFEMVLKSVLVSSMDREWMEHLEDLEQAREGNRWEGSQEEHPVRLYEKKAHEAFQAMDERVALRTLRGILSARPIPPQGS